MKKVIVTALALVVIVGLVACMEFAGSDLTTDDEAQYIYSNAKSFGMGTALDMSKEITYNQANAYMITADMLNYFKSIEQHYYETCLVDNHIVVDQDAIISMVDGNINTEYPKDEVDICEHAYEIQNMGILMMGDYENISQEDMGKYISVVFKDNGCDSNGNPIDGCFVILEYHLEKDSGFIYEIISTLHRENVPVYRTNAVVTYYQ